MVALYSGRKEKSGGCGDGESNILTRSSNGSLEIQCLCGRDVSELFIDGREVVAPYMAKTPARMAAPSMAKGTAAVAAPAVWIGSRLLVLLGSGMLPVGRAPPETWLETSLPSLWMGGVVGCG